MVKKVTEVKEILEEHGYQVRNSIFEVMKQLRCNSICSALNKSGKIKRKDTGFSLAETFQMLLMLPLFLMKTVDGLYKSQYLKLAEMQNDTLYRLQNNEKMPWRTLLSGIVKSFIKITNPKKVVADNSCFIIDDTTLQKTGKKIEGISMVYDHVAHKTILGYKLLALCLFDGVSTLPVDFSMHSEKKLKTKEIKKQYMKKRNEKNQGFKRKQELSKKKTDSAISILKRASKNGIYAKYVLFDSWFFGENFVCEIQKIGRKKGKTMDIICGVKNGKMKYDFNEEKYTAKEIKSILAKDKKAKRCKKYYGCRYYEVVVDYKGLKGIRLYICRYPHQKKWRVFVSTDSKIKFANMMKIYAIRWGIEVFFKECKQLLSLGKCQSNNFDAQIAAATRSFILYLFLSYYKRKTDYETLGGLFKEISEDLQEKNLATRLWELFKELINVVLETIEANGNLNLSEFMKTQEFKRVEEEFKNSFLSSQILEFNKAA